MLHYSIVYS